MSKLHKISIQNLKAIESFEGDFKGQSCILTASNGKGKSTVLREMINRIRFIRPDVIVTKGKESGFDEMTLDTGEKFVWQFSASGTDTLKYHTPDGKVKTNVTKELGARFFPEQFPVDEFIKASPAERTKLASKYLGIDFTAINAKYKAAYDTRTGENKAYEQERAKLEAMGNVPMVASVDLADLRTRQQTEKDRLNTLYLENKKANDIARNAWNDKKKEIDTQVSIREQERNQLVAKRAVLFSALQVLFEANLPDKEQDTLTKWINDVYKLSEPGKAAHELYPPEPTYITPEVPPRETLDKIDAEIFAVSETNTKAAAYTAYLKQTEITGAAKIAAENADKYVKEVEKERKELIASAKLPTGVSIDDNGITYKDLPLNDNQVALSDKAIVALEFAVMNLGEVKAVYFDASSLDRANFDKVVAWGHAKGLQLLIERPTWEPQELVMELIENATPPEQGKLIE